MNTNIPTCDEGHPLVHIHSKQHDFGADYIDILTTGYCDTCDQWFTYEEDGDDMIALPLMENQMDILLECLDSEFFKNDC